MLMYQIVCFHFILYFNYLQSLVLYFSRGFVIGICNMVAIHQMGLVFILSSFSSYVSFKSEFSLEFLCSKIIFILFLCILKRGSFVIIVNIGAVLSFSIKIENSHHYLVQRWHVHKLSSGV